MRLQCAKWTALISNQVTSSQVHAATFRVCLVFRITVSLSWFFLNDFLQLSQPDSCVTSGHSSGFGEPQV